MKVRILHWKRAVFAVLLTLLLSATGVTNAMAQEFTVGNLNYSVNDDGVSVTLTGHANDYLWGALDIPENVSYDGITYTVTTIGLWAFATSEWRTGGVYSLSIPSSVTSIDNDAFYFGAPLWQGLLRITVDAGNPVYDSRDNCNAIIHTSTNTLILGCKNTIIPNSVTSIGDRSFYSDGSYIIPNSVTSIGYEAFQCNMASLTIGSAVTSIYHIYSLGQGDTLRILAETPPSLGWLEYGIPDFNVVYVPCGTLDAYVAAWGDEINFQEACSTYTITATGGSSVSGTGDYSYGETCTLTATSSYSWIHFAFWIDNGQVVSRDATYTFSVSGSRLLTAGFYSIYSGNITFADPNVASICISLWDLDGNGALSYDEAALVTDLGSAFYSSNITSFDELQYFTGLSSIGEGAFTGCSNLSSVIIPNTVTSIGAYAFSDVDLSDIPSITIPNTVTSIGDYAFGESNLQYIVIPNSVTTIGCDPFYRCCNLLAVNFLSETPPEICEWGFNWCNGAMPIYVPCGAEEAYEALDWEDDVIVELCTSCIYFFELYDSEGNGWNGGYLDLDFYEESGWGGWMGGDYFYFGGDGYSATYSTDIPSGCEVHLETCCSDETPFIVRNENGEIIDVYHHYWEEYDGEDYYSFYANCGSSYHNISATANPEEGGTVSGTGVYRTGQLCTLTATANEGYTFVNWTEFGTEVSTEATFAFTATSSRNLVANFASPFSIIVEANPPEGGIVSGGGEYDYNTECTLTATANEGYTFMNWTENGEVVSTETTYCFTVNCNRNLVANFALPFTITATANPPEGGTITGSGMYDYGSTCTLTATAAEGYRFVNWTKDGVVISNDETYCHFVTGNASFMANFIAIPPMPIIAEYNPNPINPGSPYVKVHWAEVSPEIQIGEGTSTSSYFPFYTYYKYSIAENLFLASELLEVGMNTSPMTSLSWYATNAPGYEQQGISIWMANVSDSELTTASHTVNGMTLVYTGTITPEVGWNEFVFNESTFTWDGASNVLILCQRNNGEWNNPVRWQSNNVGFNASSYRYQDSGPYNVNVTNTMFTSTNRPNIIMKGSEPITYDIYRANCDGTAVQLIAENVNDTQYIDESWEQLEIGNYKYGISIEAHTNTGIFWSNCIEKQENVAAQSQIFTEGWNWWSTYIEQNGIDGLSLLENGLGTNGLVIKSQSDGYTEYYDDYDLWYGSLNAINNESSYMVKTSVPCTVTMPGTTALPSQHPITVDANGWTWIGYPVAYNMDINAALDGLASIEGDILKTQEGYAEFYEDYGWYGSLDTLTSGMGYMYKSNNDSPATFTYPDNGRTAMRDKLSAKDNHWVTMASAYPFNMTVTAVVELDGEELRSDRYELAAFANGESRGSVRLMYVEPIDRYVAFLTIAGEEAAELSFALYDTETGLEYFPAEENIVFEANATLGRLAEPFVVSFRGTTGMDELANSLRVYPNPVNAGERFSIGMNAECKAPVRVEIVNALGAVVSVETSMQAPASIMAPATAGVYTLRVTVDGKGTAVRKLVVK